MHVTYEFNYVLVYPIVLLDVERNSPYVCYCLEPDKRRFLVHLSIISSSACVHGCVCACAQMCVFFFFWSSVKPNIQVFRAKFSEITPNSIRRACESLTEPDANISDAVDVRQELDLRIGKDTHLHCV